MRGVQVGVNRLSLIVCLATLTVPAFPANRPGRDQRFFDTRVAPILTKHCLGCHNEQLKNGNISFLDRDSLLQVGSRGAAVVPGNPEASVLLDTLRHDGEIQMPPGPKLPSRDIAILTEWIRRGAFWGTKPPKQHAAPR